jgi:hypothetical protein
MITKQNTYGYLPFCTPDKGHPWFAANVVIGDTAKDTRYAFTQACGQSWETLKREGWRIVRVKIDLA